MSVRKSLLFAAAIAAMLTAVSCKKFNNGDSNTATWNLPGYSFVAFEDQEPTNMAQSSVTVYFHVPETENPDVKFGFFLSNNPSVPEGDRTEVIWDSKMKTDMYESAVQIKATFRDLDCTKTYYYRAFYSLDGKYWFSGIKSFVPGCVELGPGLKLAVCNLGAADRYAYGSYYAWGETSPKTAFTSAGYRGHSNCENGELIAQNDAVRATLGGKWRLPRIEELRMLADESKFEWSQESGCMKVTSKISGYEGKYIVLPKSGRMSDALVEDGTGNVTKGSAGSYLSSTYASGGSDTKAYIFYCSPSTHESRSEKIYYGFPVRPFLAD
ncbi:MAG: hypothetical protein IK045_00970 [Bacteroidales bacterium]|nr:hypothetical protein [Bacteroidales bacterium]